MHAYELGEHFDNSRRANTAGDIDGQALPRILIDHCHTSTVGRWRKHLTRNRMPTDIPRPLPATGAGGRWQSVAVAFFAVLADRTCATAGELDRRSSGVHGALGKPGYADSHSGDTVRPTLALLPLRARPVLPDVIRSTTPIVQLTSARTLVGSTHHVPVHM